MSKNGRKNLFFLNEFSQQMFTFLANVFWLLIFELQESKRTQIFLVKSSFRISFQIFCRTPVACTMSDWSCRIFAVFAPVLRQKLETLTERQGRAAVFTVTCENKYCAAIMLPGSGGVKSFHSGVPCWISSACSAALICLWFCVLEKYHNCKVCHAEYVVQTCHAF